VRLVDRQGDWFLVEVSNGRAVTFYLATVTQNDLRGASFQLEKQDERGTADTYQVFTGSSTDHPECDCPDFQFRQRGTCKHVDALRALQQAGKLPGLAELPCRSLVEATQRFRPGRDDEPATLPLSRRRSRANVLQLDGPDDAA